MILPGKNAEMVWSVVYGHVALWGGKGEAYSGPAYGSHEMLGFRTYPLKSTVCMYCTYVSVYS